MELHNALANLLKYQGREFLVEQRILNALDDFQGFEQHPALRNIFRILCNDGYLKKLADAKSWDASTMKFIPEIVRNYALPENLVRYSLESAAFALGYTQAPKLQQSTPPQGGGQQPPTNTPVPWSQMKKHQRELELEKKISVRTDTFSYFGLTIDAISVVIDGENLHVNYEVSGVIRHINFSDQVFKINVSIYDVRGRMRSSTVTTYICSFHGFHTESESVNPNCRLDEIGKIVLYARAE
ncbi:MAG: hypothetical protein HUK14_00285 [Muribaculaceae bacterium]|nr:hypothetical protein [Muribaculaceae bacterium]